MARAVVLYFEDNNEAEEFVALHQRARANENFEGKGSELVLMVAIPTVYCDSDYGCTSGRIKSWTRGKKYGWWVCPRCGKPAKTIALNKMGTLRSVLSQAKNLLEDGDQGVASTWRIGWGPFGRSEPTDQLQRMEVNGSGEGGHAEGSQAS